MLYPFFFRSARDKGHYHYDKAQTAVYDACLRLLQAPNQPIVFGCSWPGAAAVYARMLHPSIFPAAVATSHPLVSSPDGNNHYRSFIGHAYELYAAGGSLECKNVLQVGLEAGPVQELK